MSDDKTIYPMQVTINFHITDAASDGSSQDATVGTLGYGHGLGRLPTDEEMGDIISKVKSGLPSNYRLMDRAESMMYFMREERRYDGPNLIAPKLGNWFDPNTDVEFSNTNNRPEKDDTE